MAGEGMAHSVERPSRSAARGTHRLADVRPEELQPLDVDISRVLEIGVALWGAALVVSLLVPALHQDGREWWPWACALGLAGGVVALLYARHGPGRSGGSSAT